MESIYRKERVMEEQFWFVSRKDELAAAEELQASVLRDCVDEGLIFSRKGICFYGISGCGKSALRREIARRAIQVGDFRVVQYSMDYSADPPVVLAMLARGLEEIGVSCPCFWECFGRFTAGQPHYAAYRIDRSGNAKAWESAKTAIRAMAEPVMGIVEGLAGLAGCVLDLPANDCNFIPGENGPSVRDLSESLQIDLEKALRQSSELSILLLLDTYELITGVEKDAYPEDRDSWLEPLFDTPGTCWMLFGRGGVRDSVGFALRELDVFTAKDTWEMLRLAGILDVRLAEAVHTASRGLPLFVAVFVEAYHFARSAKGDIGPDEVSSNEKLVQVFLKYFGKGDSAAAETLCACACLERWDENILRTADPYFATRLVTLSKVRSLSFVDVYDDGVMMMHEVAARAIREQQENAHKRQAMDEAIVGLGETIEASLKRDGWGTYGWWKSVEWLCRMRRQSVELWDPMGCPSDGEKRKLALARALGKLGLHKEAIVIEREVLDSQRDRGCDKETIWESIRVLGISYSEAGYHDEAVRCYESALRDAEESCGSDSRVVVLLPRELAVAESRKAECDGGNEEGHEVALRHKIEAVERLISISQAADPETDDSDVMVALKNLAVTLWDLNRFEESYAIEKKLVRACLKKNGLRNPETLMMIDNLAGSVFSIGCDKHNEDVVRKALKIHEAVRRIRGLCLSPDHVALALSAHNIADTYRELGYYQEAWELAREARSLYLNWYGGYHPDVADSLELIAQIEDEASAAGVDILD